tara:strand:+ start:16203 stop:17378 length:1176 start_codon:yes stop_codon:yes gene_type:complete
MKIALGNSTGKGNLPVAGIVTSDLKMLHKYEISPVSHVGTGSVYQASSGDGISIAEKTYDTDGKKCSFTWWSREFSGSQWCAMLGHNSTDQHKFIVLPGSDSTLTFDGDTDGNIAKGTLNDTDLNKWNHFAVTTDGSGNVKMYQNGAPLTMTDEDISVNLTINQIGRRGAGSSGFRGNICNVGTWEDHELTAAEVKSIMWKSYADLSSTEKENMVSWWNLDEATSGSTSNVNSLVYDNHYGGESDVLGDNVLLDGTFTEAVAEGATGTYWDCDDGWSVDATQNHAFYAPDTGLVNEQLNSAINSSIVDGEVYQIKFTLSDPANGGVYVRLNDSWWSESSADLIQGHGTYTLYARAGTGTNRLEFEVGNDGLAIALKDVSVRKVNGNPGILI